LPQPTGDSLDSAVETGGPVMSTLQAQPTPVTGTPPRARAALHDPESAAMWHHHLDIETGPVGSIAVLHLAGDIDMLALPLVRAALFTALDTRPGDLVVDLSEVRFCGVRGFALLAAMARTTASCGIGYAVAGMGPHLDRAATQAWSGQRLRRHPTTAAAVTATRRGQARSHAGLM
jgi:anti-sigma B factor antagonist